MVLGSADSESGGRLVEAETVTLSRFVTGSVAWPGSWANAGRDSAPRMATASNWGRGIGFAAEGKIPICYCEPFPFSIGNRDASSGRMGIAAAAPAVDLGQASARARVVQSRYVKVGADKEKK